MTQEQWVERYWALPDEEKPELMGPSPGGAAGVLGITRQRVHQLIAQGKLEGIEFVDRQGNFLAFWVTDASIARYKATDRKPGPKPKDRRGAHAR